MISRGLPRWEVLIAAGVAIAGAGWFAVPRARPALEQARLTISQRGREFRPGQIEIKQGDVVRIVNDDEDLSHHAYVSSGRFQFDSGDQEPGHDILIPFTTQGTFNVLCGIHPKMRLTVTVR